ncbi:hypothetical protein LCGC14_0481850 [marine sediment metagenome]|uniref:Uncharacterized protein n=1 Tax=marine sediment metagenome TaxID=412755 RepID=A0A0F9S990_9ZZZZ
MRRLRLMYKIHGLNTARGMARSAGNDTFYETEEQALTAARSYVSLPSCHDAMVIYKAHVLVRRSHPPVEVLSISHDGETIPL